MCKTIEEKLSSLPKNIEFDKNNSGHVALLIAEIIRISYPIILSEIEYVLMALELGIKQSEVTRHIYLLNKLEIIDSIFYSRYRYYYSKQPTTRIINFSKLSTGRGFDERSVRMKIQQSFLTSNDAQSRKRQNAMKQILAKAKECVK